jgi:acyl-CoA thioesterase-1
MLSLVFRLPALAAAQPSEAACPAQPELMPPHEALPHVAAVLHPGGHVSVLVVGSTSVFGPEASLAPGTLTSRTLRIAPSAAAGPTGIATPPGAGDQAGPVADHPSEASFPVRMKAALEARLPGLTVSLMVRGGRSLTAEDMLPFLRAGLAVPQHPQLVIWQTGTVDAVRNVSPGQFNQSLADGTDAIIDAGADLILVDPQFSRFLQANADLPPYFGALRNAAALPGVVLFPRFELMQSWSESGGLDLEAAEPADALRSVETLHACLGKLLAEMVLDDAATP